ncbi:F0F1 ATP synthase subunit delta, partial [Streptomyces sp. NPDC059506]
MNGASREALAAARERLDALTDNTSVRASVLAEELAAVTGLLDREVSRGRGGPLTRPARPANALPGARGPGRGGGAGGVGVGGGV